MELYKNLNLNPLVYKNDEGIECIEEWRDIPNFENTYQVSDLGRLKSLERYSGSTNKRKLPSKILKQQNASGYLKIELYKNNSYERWSVHRLVMLCFEGHSDLVVDHKNNNTKDNRRVNLRYLTNRDNVSRGMKNKTSSYTGVYWDISKNKWRAHLRIDTKGYSLGCFEDEDKAKLAYDIALKNYLDTGKIPNKVPRCPPILNTETGTYYTSVKDAAIDFNLSLSQMSAMLTGARKNKTPLKYV